MWGMMRSALFLIGMLTAGLASATECVRIPGPRSLLPNGDAIFAGTVTQHLDSGTRFRITEAFKGVKGEYVDVAEFENHFEDGEQYLVFANRCDVPGERRCLYTSLCSDTRLLKYAQAVVEQLRAEKSGRRVASLYGMLWRSSAYEDYARPLANVTVKLLDGKKSFETRTDERGVYAFQRLPKGTYAVSADLPPNLALGRWILKDPVPPLDLPQRSSFQYDIYAFPTGRISGKVIGADGQPLRSTSAAVQAGSVSGGETRSL